MAGRGAAKGERRGGRQKGTPNKATIERNLVAAQRASDAIKQGKKLAKEVLEEFMFLTAGMAAVYQPLPPGTVEAPAGRAPNRDEFWKCVEMVHAFGKELAKYQSPTFKAIAVHVAPNQNTVREINPRPDASNVIDLTDTQAITRIYKLRVGGVRG